MKSITSIIIGLVGIAAIGLLTYYVVSNEKKIVVNEKPITNAVKDTIATALQPTISRPQVITNPDKDTIATAQVIQDTKFDRIKNALNIDGEEFTLTEVDGVYTNSTNDKMLIIKKNVWKKIIRKIQKKFPNIAEDCNHKYELPNLSEYKFVGLLTYLADSKHTKTTSAYTAIEIRNGIAKSFSGGNLCCDCEGEILVAQQVDAVIVK
jgi:hypothetical protein